MNNNKFIKKLKEQRGFSFVELLIVIAVLNILAAITIVAVDPGARMGQARDARRKADLRQVANALDAYFVAHEEFPYPCDTTQSEGGCSSANANTWDVVGDTAPLAVLLTEGYLKNLPSDPVNSAFFSVLQDGYSYFYVSEEIKKWGAVEGQYYMLGAFFENVNDPLTLDNLGGDVNARPRFPNCIKRIGFSGNIYLIRSYYCPGVDPVGSL